MAPLQTAAGNLAGLLAALDTQPGEEPAETQETPLHDVRTGQGEGLQLPLLCSPDLAPDLLVLVSM